jgi:hypothetical protein
MGCVGSPPSFPIPRGIRLYKYNSDIWHYPGAMVAFVLSIYTPCLSRHHLDRIQMDIVANPVATGPQADIGRDGYLLYPVPGGN